MDKYSNTFWRGKKVFLTGHTGFKGSWISIWLNHLGAEVKGYSLEPTTNENLYDIAKIDTIVESEINDIRDFDSLLSSIKAFQPEIIIHMAAQPLVLTSYKNPIETYDVNVMGTVNLLEASRSCESIKVILNITTDKCYENVNKEEGYAESDPMGGYDPYSSSKGCAELVISAYRRSFFEKNSVGVASVRAGNVIGGGDWSDNRLIPDILSSFENNKELIIRNPQAIRPWQHVIEPLAGYLDLSEKLYFNPKKFSSGWNFGPYPEDVKTVQWIVSKIADSWPKASWKIQENEDAYEAQNLKLEIQKALKYLDWKPKLNINIALEKIISWHKDWLSGYDMQKKCLEEIQDYINIK